MKIGDYVNFGFDYVGDLAKDIGKLWNKSDPENKDLRLMAVVARAIGGLGTVLMTLSTLRAAAMFVVVPAQASPVVLLANIIFLIIAHDMAIYGMNMRYALESNGQDTGFWDKISARWKSETNELKASWKGVPPPFIGTWLAWRFASLSAQRA